MADSLERGLTRQIFKRNQGLPDIPDYPDEPKTP